MSYVVTALAAIIGVLIISLKLQGSRLHKLQIGLLRAKLNLTDQANAQATLDARNAYLNAYREYISATPQK